MKQGLLIRRSGVRFPAGPPNDSGELEKTLSPDTVGIDVSQKAATCGVYARPESQSKHSGAARAGHLSEPGKCARGHAVAIVSFRLGATCKVCRAARQREWYERKRDAKREA